MSSVGWPRPYLPSNGWQSLSSLLVSYMTLANSWSSREPRDLILDASVRLIPLSALPSAAKGDVTTASSRWGHHTVLSSHTRSARLYAAARHPCRPHCGTCDDKKVTITWVSRNRRRRKGPSASAAAPRARSAGAATGATAIESGAGATGGRGAGTEGARTEGEESAAAAAGGAAGHGAGAAGGAAARPSRATGRLRPWAATKAAGAAAAAGTTAAGAARETTAAEATAARRRPEGKRRASMTFVVTS